MPTLSPDVVEDIRRELIAPRVDRRRAGLARALAFDQAGRQAVMAACDITGQGACSDEIIELLSLAWREWPILTRLCLRGCWQVGPRGCAILADQGRFTDLELTGCSQLDDAAIAELAELPLERLELWDAERCSVVAARRLASLPTLTELRWHNAVDDPSVTEALATSRSLRRLAYTCKYSTRRLLAPLAAMTALEHLSLFDIDDEVAQVIASLPRLATLEIDHAPRLGDIGADALAALPQLTSLRLIEARITDASLVRLSAAPQLESLYLINNDRIGDDGLAALGRSAVLRRLRIRGFSGITDRGLQSLERPVLVLADLRRCPTISDDGARALGRHHLLEELDLGGTRVTDDGLSALRSLLLLRELVLRDTHITQRGLAAIGQARALVVLNLRGCEGITTAPTAVITAFSSLHELALPSSAPLRASDAIAIAAACPQLRELHATFGEVGAIRAMVLLRDLHSLTIDGASDLESGELAALARAPLDELRLVDVPWLDDRALSPFEDLASLRRVEVTRCPGIGAESIRRLVRRRHLQAFGRRLRGSGGLMLLRGQLMTDAVSLFDDATGARLFDEVDDATAAKAITQSDDARRQAFAVRHLGQRPGPETVAALVAILTRPEISDVTLGAIERLVGCRGPEVIAALAAIAHRPFTKPTGGERPHLTFHPEVACQTAVEALGASGDAAAIPPLIEALRIEPTRWAYAGWALVRLARAGITAVPAALRAVADAADDVALAVRARRFARLSEPSS